MPNAERRCLLKNVVTAGESVTEGKVVAGRAVTEGEVQYKSCAHSMHDGSSAPTTPMTMDKGKQQVPELYSG